VLQAMGGWLDGWDGFDGQNGQNGWMTGWLDGREWQKG